MKSFDIRTKIYFGDNALDRLLELPYNKILIITDPFIEKSGMLTLITSRLQQAFINFDIFSDVVPDPPLEKITAGVEKFIQSDPDCIIAVGGGSAIDSAKSIREFGARATKKETALIAIPTTSGTGSEVTSFAVVTDAEHDIKYPLVSDSMLPTEAILDAELVKSVPASVTADTGMDVLTHAIEAYVSINNNEFSAALAEKAIEICGTFLLRSYLDNNDTHARAKMHVASCLAGLAFNSASLGLNHGIAHAIGAKFHIPHGRANAIVLPHVIEFNSGINKHSKSKKEYPKCVEKYCNVAKLLGVNNFNEITTIRALVGWIQFMNKEMNIPLSISQCGVDKREYMNAVESMAEKAIADSCTATNPRVPSKAEVCLILEHMYD
ncbi:MAG TPA: iron-containing alcohol dehydrogenase [Candidatus Ornithomonoglobus merdipullorum]|uniref:Iron-containing alcohol dehydrogenase n=1 Tax=Candidatus Ornithomonoglobus merdipullorum TaxID=2840895 RepID=A0A9D1SEN3_9FIRM|nr:iron-containing alcohol dehydrogenase [Candidatus Ornithomonoglobus merdipullorum]